MVGCYGVMRLAELQRVGGIPKLGNSFSPYADTLVPMLLCQHGELYWMDEPLIFLRTHEGSLSCKSEDFAAYTSAEKDFLERMKEICENDALREKKEVYVANMVRWFSENQMAVLSRVDSLSFFSAIKIFYRHQFSTILPRLPLKHKLFQIVFTVRLVMFHIALALFNKFRFTRRTG